MWSQHIWGSGHLFVVSALLFLYFLLLLSTYSFSLPFYISSFFFKTFVGSDRHRLWSSSQLTCFLSFLFSFFYFFLMLLSFFFFSSACDWVGSLVIWIHRKLVVGPGARPVVLVLGWEPLPSCLRRGCRESEGFSWNASVDLWFSD